MRFLQHPRREFLRSSILATIGFQFDPRPNEEHRASVDESWLQNLTGQHRAFFDVAALRDGILGRADNFLNVYRDEYGVDDKHVNVIIGVHGSGLPFVLNDFLWNKYQLGRLYSITDPRTQTVATRNIFVAMESSYPWPADYSITALQRRGVRFIGCGGSMRNLSRQLAKDGQYGTAEQILADVHANLVAGATRVPAMIVAQNRAQEAGLQYVYVV